MTAANAATLKIPAVAKSQRTRRTVTKGQRSAQSAERCHLKLYAYAGVGTMSLLSACLNGYANALHSPSPVAGWLMGLTVPLIILILGKVAGLLWKRRQRPLAWATGLSGAGLLALSVWHCATSIGLLTGSPIWLALPMAVGIDAGFVACELSVLVD